MGEDDKTPGTGCPEAWLGHSGGDSLWDLVGLSLSGP